MNFIKIGEDKEFKDYLIYKKNLLIQSSKLYKNKRRYKQYLNEYYIEPFAIIGRSENYYKNKIIELMIKNKWLERKLKRSKI